MEGLIRVRMKSEGWGVQSLQVGGGKESFFSLFLSLSSFSLTDICTGMWADTNRVAWSALLLGFVCVSDQHTSSRLQQEQGRGGEGRCVFFTELWMSGHIEWAASMALYIHIESEITSSHHAAPARAGRPWQQEAGGASHAPISHICPELSIMVVSSGPFETHILKQIFRVQFSRRERKAAAGKENSPHRHMHFSSEFPCCLSSLGFRKKLTYIYSLEP